MGSFKEELKKERGEVFMKKIEFFRRSMAMTLIIMLMVLSLHAVYSVDVNAEGTPQIEKIAIFDYGSSPVTFAAGSGDTVIKGFPTNIDWRQYEQAVVKYRADKDNQAFNFVLNGPDADASGKYLNTRLTAMKEWKTTAIPISKLTTPLASSTDGKHIGRIKLNGNGWSLVSGTHYTPGTPIYVESLYLERDASQYLPNINGFTYTVSNKEATIKGIDIKFLPAQQQGNIEIPSALEDGTPVTAIADNAFKRNANIRTVSIPGSVKKIGAGAFESCTNLEEVQLNPGLESIGNRGFYACTGLKEFYAPPTLKSIGAEAFRTCNALQRVVLSPAITSIGDSAFGRSTVREIYFPEEIPASAYGNNLVGGYIDFETITAYGEAGSYIKTLAETALDDWHGESTGKKLYNFVEVKDDILIFNERLVDESGFDMTGTGRDIGNKIVGYGATLYNTSEKEITPTVYMAAFDRDNEKEQRISAVSVTEVPVPPYTEKKISVSDVKLETEVLDGTEIKVFMVQSQETLRPVKPVFSVHFDQSIQEYRVLSIGNSFCQDSIVYLQAVAAADGVKITPYNCYIGGCTLGTHSENLTKQNKLYEMQLSGARGPACYSIQDALAWDDWDVVVLQATTHHMTKDTSLWNNVESDWVNMRNGVKEACPDARRLVHLSWAPSSDLAAQFDGGRFAGAVSPRAAYAEAVLPHYKFGADIYSGIAGEMIPTALAVERAITEHGLAETEGKLSGNVYPNANGSMSIYRDTTCHLTTTARVMASLVWYEMITGNSALENTYVGPGLNEESMQKLREAAHYACANYQK